MRVTLEQFLNKLGIDVILRPYETLPFDFFNVEKGLDVMAEVSLSGDSNVINTEIQIIENMNTGKTKFRQVLQMQLVLENNDTYVAKSLRYNGEQIAGKRLNWFDGACRFIKQSMALIKKGTVPDFETLYQSTINAESGANTGGGSGGGGRGLKNDRPPAKPSSSSRF